MAVVVKKSNTENKVPHSLTRLSDFVFFSLFLCECVCVTVTLCSRLQHQQHQFCFVWCSLWSVADYYSGLDVYCFERTHQSKLTLADALTSTCCQPHDSLCLTGRWKIDSLSHSLSLSLFYCTNWFHCVSMCVCVWLESVFKALYFQTLKCEKCQACWCEKVRCASADCRLHN